MTKAEELAVLGKIEKLIAETGNYSYIAMTFAGICDVCKSNIQNDFGDSPVTDLKELRESHIAEIRMHEETKRMLAESQMMCRKTMDENEHLRKLSAEWEQNAHDAGEMYCELEKEIVEQNAEIIRLRAEIVRMKLERMTEEDYANLYIKMKGE